MKTLVRRARYAGFATALPLAAAALHLVAAAQPPTAAANAGTAAVLEINGAIGPATSRYVVHGLEAAQKNGSRVVVLEIDTPGTRGSPVCWVRKGRPAASRAAPVPAG